MENKVDLSDLINPPSAGPSGGPTDYTNGAAASGEPTDYAKLIEDSLTRFTTALSTLYAVTRSIQTELGNLVNRISLMEKFVSYLLEKDPEMGPKIKKALEKSEAKTEPSA